MIRKELITEHCDGVKWIMIEGVDCEISLEPRPSYCDRGNWLAKIHIKAGGNAIKLNLDHADGWPRYYFDYDRALAEIEAWLVKRGQMIPDRPPGHRTTLAKGMGGEEVYILDTPPTPPVS